MDGCQKWDVLFMTDLNEHKLDILPSYALMNPASHGKCFCEKPSWKDIFSAILYEIWLAFLFAIAYTGMVFGPILLFLALR